LFSSLQEYKEAIMAKANKKRFFIV